MTYDECRDLQRLADVARGIAKTLMLAYSFTDELITASELVLIKDAERGAAP